MKAHHCALAAILLIPCHESGAHAENARLSEIRGAISEVQASSRELRARVADIKAVTRDVKSRIENVDPKAKPPRYDAAGKRDS